MEVLVHVLGAVVVHVRMRMQRMQMSVALFAAPVPPQHQRNRLAQLTGRARMHTVNDCLTILTT